jgi:hypothetical protein
MLTVIYSTDALDNLVPDGQITKLVDRLVAIANQGVGHKVVTIGQEAVIDEIRLRSVLGEFQVPVEVRVNHPDGPAKQWVGLITEYGTLPDAPWYTRPDRSSLIISAAIQKRRLKQEQQNGN